MLETLDSVDWTNLSRIRQGVNIAAHIRLLLSPDATDRNRARAVLFSALNPDATIYDATAASIPFLLELVAEEQTPDRIRILEFLYRLAETCEFETWEIVHLYPYKKLGFLRLVNDAYEKLAAGYEVYLRLLTHEDMEIRAQAAAIAGQYPERAKAGIPQLWSAIERETDSRALAVQLRNFGLLLWGFEAGTPRSTYYAGLVEIAIKSTYETVRVEAALAALCADRFLNRRPENFPVSLMRQLVVAISTPKQYDITKRILDVLRRTGPETLIDFLAVRPLTPEAAHLLGRELLGWQFHRTNGMTIRDQSSLNWSDEGDWERFEATTRKDGLPLDATYRRIGWPNKTLGTDDQAVLRAIVDCEPFWQLPTNLFSFFFGLPDDRAALRKLQE